jgi:hypothetical protein
MKSLKHLFLLLAITPFAFGVVELSSLARHSPQTESADSGASTQTIKSEDPTSAWDTYQDPSTGFTFRYPKNLTLSRVGNRIKLKHSIKYKHHDPCDSSDNTRPLLRLVDFDISLELVDERTRIDPNLKQSKDADHGGITIGSLKGEYVRNSLEGCGEYRYRFPVEGDRTLVVQREIIGIFSPTSEKLVDEKIVLKQPGIIKPEKAERLFKAILSTFKLTEPK